MINVLKLQDKIRSLSAKSDEKILQRNKISTTNFFKYLSNRLIVTPLQATPNPFKIEKKTGFSSSSGLNIYFSLQFFNEITLSEDTIFLFRRKLRFLEEKV